MSGKGSITIISLLLKFKFSMRKNYMVGTKSTVLLVQSHGVDPKRSPQRIKPELKPTKPNCNFMEGNVCKAQDTECSVNIHGENISSFGLSSSSLLNDNSNQRLFLLFKSIVHNMLRLGYNASQLISLAHLQHKINCSSIQPAKKSTWYENELSLQTFNFLLDFLSHSPLSKLMYLLLSWSWYSYNFVQFVGS